MEVLTNEELQARLATLESDKKALEEKAEALENEKAASEEKLAKLKSENDKLQAINKEIVSPNSVTFEVEEDEDDADSEPGTYEFTAPLLTWDDASIIDIKALSESKEKADQQLYAEICATLVQRKSGLVRRKEN